MGQAHTSCQPPSIAEFPAEHHNASLIALLEHCQHLHEQNRQLRDEVARLKGHCPKPNIPRSRLEKPPKRDEPDKAKPRRNGKRAKKATLPIHATYDRQVPPHELPEGARFKGYEQVLVQDLVIQAHNTCYRLARWQLPGGGSVRAALPPAVQDSLYGPTLRAFVLDQHHRARVTQPMLLEQLRSFGVDISAGTLNKLLTEQHEAFHAEKHALLRRALRECSYLQTDDTGARHQGNNGYCTVIGNEHFAWFASTERKSRTNFLELLAGEALYTLNDHAFNYMLEHGLAAQPLDALVARAPCRVEGREAWQSLLSEVGIYAKAHIRKATEGALLATVRACAGRDDLVIVSDDAGQFAVFEHALCWVHAERNIAKLIPITDAQTEALEAARDEIWRFYNALKAYKKAPCEAKKSELAQRFDTLCTTPRAFPRLDEALARMHANKAKLLRVLKHPHIPLHNNGEEQDLRPQVIKRKVSGSTRSDNGQRSRDTFASLIATCRKNRLSFWRYLTDRLAKTHDIPTLSDWVFKPSDPSAAQPTGPPTP